MITPWNFPLALPGRKIAGALAAGCTTIVKPTKECPLSLILLAEAARDAGLPEGCLNVVFGPGKEIGRLLMEAKSIRKLSFTGSTEVGKHLYEQSAATVKKLTLELGGHAPLIVFDDADLELAVKQTLAAKLRNSGQTCIAPNRLFIQKGIYGDFVELLKKEVLKLRYGNPLKDEIDLTTILHPTSVEKVQDHIADALAKGATAVLKPDHAYEVAILEHVDPSMKLFTEETFGPVFPLIPFETEEEAVMRANESDYGLAAYLFTSSMERGYRVARGLEYGIIGFNDGGPSAPEASFGGVKYSGFGREGGPNGIREYLTEKCVSLLD
jgi:succinate-semialdehyde dehydrogenase/glutarate-semialdehyde dehydrogenase